MSVNKWADVNGDKYDAERIAKWFFQVDDPRQHECEELIKRALGEARAAIEGEPTSEPAPLMKHDKINELVVRGRDITPLELGAALLADLTAAYRRAASEPAVTAPMSECFHINLIKQGGPLDGGPAKSTRYRCTACGAFVVTEPYEVGVTMGTAKPEGFSEWWKQFESLVLATGHVTWADREIAVTTRDFARAAFMAGWDARGERK